MKNILVSLIPFVYYLQKKDYITIQIILKNFV